MHDGETTFEPHHFDNICLIPPQISNYIFLEDILHNTQEIIRRNHTSHDTSEQLLEVLQRNRVMLFVGALHREQYTGVFSVISKIEDKIILLPTTFQYIYLRENA